MHTLRSAVDDLVRWCDNNHLLLNATKTKEMVIDFRKMVPKPSPLVIKGGEVETVHQYKYLGTILDDRLDWSANAVSPQEGKPADPFHEAAQVV